MTVLRPEAAPGTSATARRRRRQLLIPVILILVGVIVLIYPVMATNFNNVKQRQFAERYHSEVEAAPDHQLSDALAAARAYNATLPGVPILDPWLTQANGPPESEAYQAYLAQLNAFDTMARVRVPSVNIDLPIHHGTTDGALATGAGHLYGTALPVGGSNTHAVMTSHTAFSNATLFDHLDKVTEGDLILIDVYGETLAYQVDQLKVVLPTEIGDLRAQPGQDQLTLFTCTPYAVNTHRLLVRGHRVPYNPAEDARTSPITGGLTFEPWMYGMIAGALGGVVMLGVLIVVNRRRTGASAARASTG